MKMKVRVSFFWGIIRVFGMMDLFSISPLFVASFFHFSLEDSPNLQSEIRSSLESTRARCIATKSPFLREQTK